MCLTGSFLSCLYISQARIALFLRRTTAKHRLGLLLILTSDGSIIVALGLSFKFNGMWTNSFTSSTIILWWIIQAWIMLKVWDGIWLLKCVSVPQQVQGYIVSMFCRWRHLKVLRELLEVDCYMTNPKKILIAKYL